MQRALLILALLVGSISCDGSTDVEEPAYEVTLALTSDVTGQPVTAPDGLVGDTIQVTAVVRRGGQVVPHSGLQVVQSSDVSVASVVIGSEDRVAFRGEGTSRLLVTLEEPVVEGGLLTDSLDVTVTSYRVELEVESLFAGGSVDPGLALVSDSVRFSGRVIRGVADTTAIAGASWSSSDEGVVEIVSAGTGTGRFVGPGAAVVRVSFTEPAVPASTDSLAVDVATYVVEISGPGTTPIMGDSVDYDVTVTDTRGDTALTTFGVTFESTDGAVVEIVNGATGRAFARDIGTATVSVKLDAPLLPDPDSTLADALAPTTITEERFYGTFDVLTGDFGDEVVVEASQVHRFTATTEVRFPNGSSGFVDSVSVAFDSLFFTVGAGTNAGQLTLINLEDDLGGARDTVLTKDSFTGQGTVDDPFEPNDAFPLPDTAAVNISNALPFKALLSVDTLRTAPSDTNFFWLSVGSGDMLDLDVRAETQQDADIDFFICNGLDNPPTDYDDGTCVRLKTANGPGRVEEALGVALGPNRHVFGFYCVDGCTASNPLVTYKVTIIEN